MRLILVGAFLAILSAIAFSFVPGNGLSGYENKGLGLVSALVSITLTLAVIFAAILYGARAPAALYWLLVHPPIRFRNRLSRHDRALTRAILIAAISQSDSPSPTAGEVLSQALRTFPAHAASGSTVWARDLAVPCREIQVVAGNLRNSPAARFFIPDRAQIIANVLDQVHDVISVIIMGEPIRLSELVGSDSDAPPPELFRSFVSDFSGADVFVDAVHTRAGFARDVRVFHRGNFRDGSESSTEAPVRASNYEHSHITPTADSECVWRDVFRAQPKTRPDDFDGHVVELLAAELTRDNHMSGVAFTLTTGETCYAATEVSALSKDHSENPLRCKGLGPESSPTYDARWEFDDTHALVRRAHPVTGRASLLTVSALVIQEFTDPSGKRERSVVLLERPNSAAVRNGGDVLALPGGVMTINRNSPDADLDEHNVPDPGIAARLELAEELGLNIPLEALTPLSVFAINERGPNSLGQLVSTVAYRVEVPLSQAELLARRREASTHAGRYESVGLTFIEVPTELELAGMNFNARGVAALEYARTWLRFAGRIDQRTMVAALYLGAELFDATAIQAAFEQVWPSKWHQLQWESWDELPADGLGRLVRVRPIR